MLELPNVLEILFRGGAPVIGHDFVDKVNFVASVFILCFFAVLTGTKQHFGSPIQCAAPAESPDSWVNYFHDYCYILPKVKVEGIHDSRTTQYDRTPLKSRDHWDKDVLNYYQWVPYVLVIQAVMFLGPRLIFKFLGLYVCQGCDVEYAVGLAGKLKDASNEEERTKTLQYLTRIVSDCINWKNRRLTFGHRSLTFSYVVMKWLMLGNLVSQMILMAHFIGNGDYLWGFNLLKFIFDSSAARDPTAGIFPRVIKCVVPQKELANLHVKNMLCVLMMNFVNEKIYLFLYFWCLLVMFLTSFSVLHYSLFLLMRKYRQSITESLLPTQDILVASANKDLGVHSNPLKSHNLTKYFVNTLLKTDGALTLLFIRQHAGGLITHDLVTQLWKLRVQPPLDYDDVEYCEKTNSFSSMQGAPAKMFKRQIRNAKQHGGSIYPLDAEKGIVDRKPLSRGRSLSLGVATEKSNLPTAPHMSSRSGSSIVDDATLPFRSSMSELANRRYSIVDNRRDVIVSPEDV